MGIIIVDSTLSYWYFYKDKRRDQRASGDDFRERMEYNLGNLVALQFF